MKTPASRQRPVTTWVAMALVVVMASAGSAVAASLVTSKQIKDHTIKMVDINKKTSKTLRYSSVPSGVTVRGVWGGFLNSINSVSDFRLEFISFPLPLPRALKEAKVKFGTKGVNGTTNTKIAAAVKDSDESVQCTGTFRKPTAPAGMVCIYVRNSYGPFNIADGSLTADPPEQDATPAPNKYGFVIGWKENNSASNARIEGTWAYTAP